MAAPQDNNEFNYGDIYHKLGSLEGKIDSVVDSLKERRNDINAVYNRLRSVENKTSIGVGVALALSFIIPILITAASPRIKFQEIYNQPESSAHTDQGR